MSLRACPDCRSRAVSAIENEDDGLKKRYHLRCGECGAWRTAALGMLASFRLDRALRRDLRRLARELSELEAAEPADTTVEWQSTRS